MLESVGCATISRSIIPGSESYVLNGNDVVRHGLDRLEAKMNVRLSSANTLESAEW